MGLTKKIAFDENSMPPKDQIWYRGEGKFYEYKDGKWVLAYDLAGTPSQEELDSVANVIEEKTEKTLEDKSLPGILSGILNLIPAAPTPQVQANLFETNPESPAYVNGIFRLVFQDTELLDVPEGSKNLFMDTAVPFVGTTTGNQLFPFVTLTDTQSEGLKAIVEQRVGVEIVEIISFFGRASQLITDGSSGFAIINLDSSRVCYIYCDI